MVHLTSPYVPEYLAFREVGFLVDSISRLQKQKPELLPEVIMECKVVYLICLIISTKKSNYTVLTILIVFSFKIIIIKKSNKS